MNKANLKPIEICPECSGPVKALDDLIWCDQCEWNLNPYQQDLKIGWRDRWSRRSDRKLANRAFQERSASMGGSLLSLLEAFVGFSIAALVHLVSLGFLALTIDCFQSWPNRIAFFFGVIFLIFAFLTLPRIRKWPAKRILDRQQFSKIYELADQISDDLHSPRVAGIELTCDFDIHCENFRRPFQNRKLLSIGWPLIDVFSGRNLTTLIANEMLSGGVQETAESSFLNSALLMLQRWQLIFQPESLTEGPKKVAWGGVIIVLSNLARQLIFWILKAMEAPVQRALRSLRQRRIYRADISASLFGGTQTLMEALLQLNTQQEVFLGCIQRVALTQKSADLFDEIRAAVRIPDEKSLRSFYLQELRLGRSWNERHPPLAYRIWNLRQNSKSSQELPFNPPVDPQLRFQLQSFRTSITQQLLDRYRNQIYFSS